MLSVNMDDTVKQEFTKIVNELGMNATTAVNLFARSVIREQGLPFPVTLRTSSEQEWNDYKNRQFQRGIASMESGDMLTVEQAKQMLGVKRPDDE